MATKPKTPAPTTCAISIRPLNEFTVEICVSTPVQVEFFRVIRKSWYTRSQASFDHSFYELYRPDPNGFLRVAYPAFAVPRPSPIEHEAAMKVASTYLLHPQGVKEHEVDLGVEVGKLGRKYAALKAA
jgi:hypothetical protein